MTEEQIEASIRLMKAIAYDTCGQFANQPRPRGNIEEAEEEYRRVMSDERVR